MTADGGGGGRGGRQRAFVEKTGNYSVLWGTPYSIASNGGRHGTAELLELLRRTAAVGRHDTAELLES